MPLYRLYPGDMTSVSWLHLILPRPHAPRSCSSKLLSARMTPPWALLL